MKKRLILLAIVLAATAACGAQPVRSGGAHATPHSRPSTEPAASTPQVAAPVRLTIPRIKIDTRLDRLALEPDGTLEKPPHWQVAGWYAGGPRPGAPGPAVVAGHIDSPGGLAVFARLSELHPGDVVRVRTADGEAEVFRVDRLVSAPKDHFPTAAVYGPTPDSQLRLITCDGVYDKARDGYQDNLVVFATKVSS